MVNAADIRIGNLMFGNRENEIVKIAGVSLNIDCFNVKDMRYGEWKSGKTYISPIKLTKEVLECTNMEHFTSLRSRSENIYTFGDYYLIDKFEDNNFYFSDWTKESCYFNNGRTEKISEKPLLFLHQLQNLYYSLVGEELKIDREKLNKIRW